MKRSFDLFFSLLGLCVLSPVLAVLALLVKLSDGGPVFYRQERVGQGGRPFHILKFRSMVVNADRIGLPLTRAGDPRITRVGRFMRKTKLDELPQLWNVLVGEMSFVGPRPEMPSHAELYTGAQRQVLHLRPGITSLASIEFWNEEELLSSAADAEKFYIEYCVPRKSELNLAYSKQANVWQDTKIILRTLFARKQGSQQGRSLRGSPVEVGMGERRNFIQCERVKMKERR